MFEPFTLDQITIFLAVVDEGGFSAAGRRLGRVQSAVSHSIASLEETLGARLFDRSSRRPVLTDAGERLAAEARLVLAQARELRQVAGSIREGLETELSLAVDPLYPSERLVPVLRAFHEAHPTVSLRVVSDVLGEAVRLVRDGHVDLGVCNLVETHDDVFDSIPLGRVRLVPVCAPDHPLASDTGPLRANRLRQWTQVVLTERTIRSEDHGVLAAHTWRVTDLGTKIELIRAGVGWGSAPEPLVRDAIAAGDLVRLEPGLWPDGGHIVVLHSVVRTDRPLGPAGSWLRRELVLPAVS
ncbi:MAG: LysR family transcriptional regulator [Alphaproteobacteria bacterium]|nr:LysR family transcriptional regulator [Alphaproteobacteria bacterium]